MFPKGCFCLLLRFVGSPNLFLDDDCTRSDTEFFQNIRETFNYLINMHFLDDDRRSLQEALLNDPMAQSERRLSCRFVLKSLRVTSLQGDSTNLNTSHELPKPIE